MPHPEKPTAPDEPLLVRLRELKDGTGLSLAALAARTPYSKSAWHRYLTGAQRPPRPAVEALARLARVDPGPVLALWEATGHTADEPHLASPPDGTGPRRPGRRRWLPLCALALAGLTAVVGAAVAVHDRSDSTGTPVVMTVPHCHGPSCRGELPDATACARDARTTSTVTDPAYTLRLRYSPACGTVWSEVRVRSPHAREVSVRAGQDVLSATYPAEDTTGYTSPMLSVRSPRGVEACAEVAEQLACTGMDVQDRDEG
ncbi:XRE family transcriptional regulator [Streptomyces sp. NPDC006739]|uniref:XRE family transcriptional regulator n=1 Tax=Streptomyces sp. NPDC006739 TaxID=3364763 RepID=UPI00368C8798